MKPRRISRAAPAVATVATAAAGLRPVAEAVALAALDDPTLVPLTDLLTEAEATASRWLVERDPRLASLNVDGRDDTPTTRTATAR